MVIRDQAQRFSSAATNNWGINVSNCRDLNIKLKITSVTTNTTITLCDQPLRQQRYKFSEKAP